jgi:hypothetical protein
MFNFAEYSDNYIPAIPILFVIPSEVDEPAVWPVLAQKQVSRLITQVRHSYFARFPRGSTPTGGFAPSSGGWGHVISVHVPEFPKFVL